MEVREVTEVKVYVLVLNTMGAAEDGAIVAISPEYDNLVNYYYSELLEEGKCFRDDSGYWHYFREGDLYWYNPCASLELNNISPWGHGIHDEWVNLNILNSKKYKVV